MTHLHIVLTVAAVAAILVALLTGWLWLCNQPGSRIDTTWRD